MTLNNRLIRTVSNFLVTRPLWKSLKRTWLMVDRYVDFGERLPVLKNQIPYDKRSGIANIRCLIISEIYVTQIKWTFPNFISLIIKVQ